ncbi:MAG: hypothetical protein JRE28_15150 [Deltaproteobacteria bacterium]|nr:hypothetical protein [Deltaproteobacteria bacterium]
MLNKYYKVRGFDNNWIPTPNAKQELDIRHE